MSEKLYELIPPPELRAFIGISYKFLLGFGRTEGYRLMTEALNEAYKNNPHVTKLRGIK